ncbi:MarR family winged helix-turn-helix transcriptional regulator [Streptomyces sp. NPDC002540]
MRDDVEQVLKPTGNTLRHLAALGHLRREPGFSCRELGCPAGITVQSAQVAVRRLEERGAVERRTDAGRGRTAEFHITEDGMRLLAAGRDPYAAADAGLQGALGPDACRHLAGLLLQALSARASCPPRTVRRRAVHRAAPRRYGIEYHLELDTEESAMDSRTIVLNRSDPRFRPRVRRVADAGTAAEPLRRAGSPRRRTPRCGTR